MSRFSKQVLKAFVRGDVDVDVDVDVVYFGTQYTSRLHIEARPRLLHPPLPLPFLPTLELDPAIYPPQLKRHARSGIN